MRNEEAIEILKEIEYPVNGDNRECRDTAYNMAIKALENERPKGKWKYEFLCPPVSCCSGTRITCSRCRYSRLRIDGEILKYCPNCGEEMRN